MIQQNIKKQIVKHRPLVFSIKQQQQQQQQQQQKEWVFWVFFLWPEEYFDLSLSLFLFVKRSATPFPLPLPILYTCDHTWFALCIGSHYKVHNRGHTFSLAHSTEKVSAQLGARRAAGQWER